jgi:hypothetical protein
MASLAQLMKGGSFTPLPGGGFSFNLKIKTKFKLDTARVRRKLGEATADALKFAGYDVKKATRREMSNRTPTKRAQNWKIASRHGFDLYAQINRVPKSDRVTSWKTPRHPDGFLRSDIESNYDTRSKTVVIGPSKIPRINRLHEFGGQVTVYFKPIPRPPGSRWGNRIYGVLTNRRPKVTGSSRIQQAGIYSFTRNVKPRRYMEKGLQKALPRIPKYFKNMIRVSGKR